MTPLLESLWGANYTGSLSAVHTGDQPYPEKALEAMEGPAKPRMSTRMIDELEAYGDGAKDLARVEADDSDALGSPEEPTSVGDTSCEDPCDTLLSDICCG